MIEKNLSSSFVRDGEAWSTKEETIRLEEAARET